MIVPPQMPFIRQEHGSNSPCVQKDAVPEAASAVWLAGSLCYTSGTGASTVLNRCATAATLVYGQSPDKARFGGALTPPDAPFGLNHFCFDVRDRILEMTLAGSTGGVAVLNTANGVTWAGGGTSGVAMAPGQKYGLFTATTGPYAGFQFVDPNNGTQLVFEIVALAPGQAVTDNNPRVLVKVIPTVIQG